MDEKWFRDRMADKGVTASKLAALLEINHGNMSRRLKGTARITLDDARIIADALGVAYDDVVRKAGIAVRRDSRAAVPFVGVVGIDGRIAKHHGSAERPAAMPDDAAALLLRVGNGWDNCVAYYVPSSRLEPDAVGRLAVVGKKLGFLARGSERGKWDLRGIGGNWENRDISVETAAPVVWIKV